LIVSGSLSVDRYRGAVVGLAVGDALGAPAGRPAGTWTASTAMALCLADSLVESEGFDPVDQLHRYVRWYRDGDYSSTGTCVGIGAQTRAAVERFERTGEAFPGAVDAEANGLEPLVRLAPVALTFAADPAHAAECAATSARTTHGGRETVNGARVLARLVALAASGRDGADLMEPVAHESVANALRLLGATDSFEDGMIAAIGHDPATATIFGQLAGAVYGFDAIPGRWRSDLAKIDWIMVVAEALHSLAIAQPCDRTARFRPGTDRAMRFARSS
jgi:ADP-ribosylglycohydrolase